MAESLWKLAACMIVTLLSLSLYSCGDKDDKEEENDPCRFLYGTWLWKSESNTHGYDHELTFSKQGKGTWHYLNDERDRTDQITYSYDPETQIITFIEYREKYQVLDAQTNQIKLLSLWDNDEEIWIRKIVSNIN